MYKYFDKLVGFTNGLDIDSDTGLVHGFRKHTIRISTLRCGYQNFTTVTHKYKNGTKT